MLVKSSAMSESRSGPIDAYGEPRRDTPRDARQRWAREVKEALDERRLSINAAAKAIGITPGRLQAWISQDVEPAPRYMGALAKVIGRSHLQLLQLLGWLPPQLGDAPLRLEASGKLYEAVAEARRWLHGTGSVPYEDGHSLARAVLSSSSEWEVRLRNETRGLKYQVHYSTQLEFLRVAADDERRQTDTVQDTAGDRQEILGLASGAIERSWSRWLTQPEASTAAPMLVRPDLLMSSPVLCAARSRGLQPDLRVPASMAVLGVPLFGAQEVAALVAGLLDWAYFDLACAAREVYGPDGEESAQIQMARRLLRDAETTANLTVWSCDATGSILKSFREIGQDLPLVVLLMAPESTLEYTIRRLDREGIQIADEIETAQNVVRRTLAGQRDAHTYLILDLPEVDPGSDATNSNPDVLFDSYVELAFQVAEWLHDEHGAPRLSQASGLLSELKRRAETEDEAPPN